MDHLKQLINYSNSVCCENATGCLLSGQIAIELDLISLELDLKVNMQLQHVTVKTYHLASLH